MIAQKIQRDRPVHGATVNVHITKGFRELTGQGTLPAGAPSIYSYNDFLHLLRTGIQLINIASPGAVQKYHPFHTIIPNLLSLKNIYPKVHPNKIDQQGLKQPR
jgi:hypothetical protein